MRKILFVCVLCVAAFSVSCIRYTDEEQAVIDYLAYFNAGTYTHENFYSSGSTLLSTGETLADTGTNKDNHVSDYMQLKFSSTGRILELYEYITLVAEDRYEQLYEKTTETMLFRATLEEDSITSKTSTSTYSSGLDYKGEEDEDYDGEDVTVTLTIDKDDLDGSGNTKEITLSVKGRTSSGAFEQANATEFTLTID